MTDLLIRGTGAQGGIRLVAVITTETIKEASYRHSLSYLTSIILGRTMTAGLLLASSMKVAHGRVTIRFRSDGPIKGVIADAGRDGSVRGYVGNPNLELDLIKNINGGHYFDFKKAMGTGYLHVIRDEGKGEPFSSTVEIVGGGIGEDIASYLLHSEQTSSVVFLGEKIERSKLICSGGLIAEIMPKAMKDYSIINTLERKCRNIDDFSEKLFKCKNNLPQLFNELFPEINPEPIKFEDAKTNIKFSCPCSRNRSISALKLLGREEIQKIIYEDKKAEIKCEFCKETYLITEEELNEIICE